MRMQLVAYICATYYLTKNSLTIEKKEADFQCVHAPKYLKCVKICVYSIL